MDSLTSTLGALADPTRRAILRRLTRGPADVRSLTRPFKITQQAVSKHLAVLERARLIRKGRDGRRQVCSLRTEPFADVTRWIDAQKRECEERLDRLAAYLEGRKETLRARPK